MKITHDAWKCEICGHKWLAMKKKPPQKCAKCKSRRWHTEPIPFTGRIPNFTELLLGNQVRRMPNAAQIKPFVQSLEEEAEYVGDTVTEIDPEFR